VAGMRRESTGYKYENLKKSKISPDRLMTPEEFKKWYYGESMIKSKKIKKENEYIMQRKNK
jgi:hypothetical protein